MWPRCHKESRQPYVDAPHYFFSAANVPFPTAPYSQVPLIFEAPSSVPLYTTLPASAFSNDHSTWFPFTVPDTFASPKAPAYVPENVSPVCLNTNVAVPLPASNVTAALQVPEMAAACSAKPHVTAKATKMRNLRMGAV